MLTKIIVTGCLDLSELSTCLSEVMGTVISVDATKIACDEFDKDASDTIDIAEFSLMVVRCCSKQFDQDVRNKPSPILSYFPDIPPLHCVNDRNIWKTKKRRILT